MQGIDPAAVTSLSALVRGFYKELRKQLDTQQGAVPEVVWRIHDDGEASPPPVQWPEPDLLPEPPRRLASGFPPSEDAASYPQPPSSHVSIAGPSDLLGAHFLRSCRKVRLVCKSGVFVCARGPLLPSITGYYQPPAVL